MYLSNSLFIDVWSRDAGTFGYSLTRGAGYWLKLGGVGSSVRPRSLGGNITPSTGWLLCSFFSNRFSLSISHFLSSSCFSNSLFLSTSFSFSLASSCCRSNSNFLYKKKRKKKEKLQQKAILYGWSFFQVMAHADWWLRGPEKSISPSRCCERAIRFFPHRKLQANTFPYRPRTRLISLYYLSLSGDLEDKENLIFISFPL